jgi:hypothetical protein
MIGFKDKIWSLREGLFAKYVIALVGLVVFVLAVNGAIETWLCDEAKRARRSPAAVSTAWSRSSMSLLENALLIDETLDKLPTPALFSRSKQDRRGVLGVAHGKQWDEIKHLTFERV